MQVGSLEIQEGAARGGKERETGGGGLCMRKRRGDRAQRCAEEECRLFPCVGRTGELCWLQSGAVSPNEKSCVGHGGSPRHCRPEAKHSQRPNHSVARSRPHMLLTHMVVCVGGAERNQHGCH